MRVIVPPGYYERYLSVVVGPDRWQKGALVKILVAGATLRTLAEVYEYLYRTKKCNRLEAGL